MERQRCSKSPFVLRCAASLSHRMNSCSSECSAPSSEVNQVARTKVLHLNFCSVYTKMRCRFFFFAHRQIHLPLCLFWDMQVLSCFKRRPLLFHSENTEEKISSIGRKLFLLNDKVFLVVGKELTVTYWWGKAIKLNSLQSITCVFTAFSCVVAVLRCDLIPESSADA